MQLIAFGKDERVDCVEELVQIDWLAGFQGLSSCSQHRLDRAGRLHYVSVQFQASENVSDCIAISDGEFRKRSALP